MDKRNNFVPLSIICYLFGFGSVSSYSLNDTCKTEITHGFKQNYTWNISTTTGFYASIPNCLDDKGDIIERYCHDSVLIPESVVCHETFKRNNYLRSSNDVSTPKVETILVFDSKRQKMYLMLYNLDNVERVNCYTFVFKEQQTPCDLLFDSKNISLPYSMKRYLIYELEISNYPSEYWCEISQKNNSAVVTTQRVVGQEDDEVYQEYVMKVSLNQSFTYENFTHHCDRLNAHCRPLKLTEKGYVLIHVTLHFKNNDVIHGYHKLLNYFGRIITLQSILSADHCLPSKTFTNQHLFWTLTPLGEKAKPTKLCLDDTGGLITRKCIGDFLHGAYFEEFKQKCSENVTISNSTVMLYEILSKHNFTMEMFKNFSSIIKGFNVSVNDISLFSDGLFQASEVDYYEDIEEDYFDSIDTLNSIDHSILNSSQVTLNATDRILDSLEKFLEKMSETSLNESRHTTLIQRSNFIVYATKPSFSNISGIALYGNRSTSLLDYSLRELSNNDTLESIPRENLELALHVPRTLLDLNGNSSLIITIYYNDTLFNEENMTNQANSRVIGVTMPGMGKCLQVPIPLLLRPLKTMNGTFIGCGYWEYGKASPSRKGQWSTKGGEDIDIDNLIYCAYSHLTHFGLLIISGRADYIKEGVTIIIDSFLPYNTALNTITIIGCSLSLAGITGIFVTACMFRRFRDKMGTKILMLLSFPISLEIILTQLAGLDNWHNNSTVCRIIGILLHYVVLLKFSWMVIIALLQYLRFVKVLGSVPQRIFLKANLVCWIVPVIPVLLSAIILPESYTAGVQKFCYPKDWALYLGLFVPASIIVLFNILVFILIMVSISNSKAVKYDKSGVMLRRQTYLAILLFFMLGIPWVFGILAEMLQSGWLEITFVYLFCLTATLQGFVLFTFYVIFDKDTRSLWVIYIKYRRS